MSDLHVALAGRVTMRRADRRVSDAGLAGRQVRLVLAILVLGRAQPVPVDVLADAVWSSARPDHWRVALRGLVSQVRRAFVDLGLPPESVTGSAGSYRVDLPDVHVDLEDATAAARAAHRRLQDGDDLHAVRDLANHARAVLSRPILPGIESEWLDGLRDRQADHLSNVLIDLGTCRSRLGLHVEARTALAEVVERSPLREDAWRALMQADLEAGNAAMALRAYEDCRHVLREDLGVDPSGATQRLHGDILRAIPTPLEGDRDVTSDVQPSETGLECAPYVGLRAFGGGDAGVFFGRDDEVSNLVHALARRGIAVVVGPSGVGKSSLVRAGLLPALAHGALPDSDTWIPVVCTPGREPMGSLAAATAAAVGGSVVTTSGDTARDWSRTVEAVMEGSPPSARLLVVVDQFEEVFTLADPVSAAGFVDDLIAAVRPLDSRVAVVMTMRADFYERATAVPALAGLLTECQYVVPPLAPEQVEAVVAGPARRAGVQLEPGLLARIVADTADEPGALPLLQHLLRELWSHRTNDVMTRGAYEDLGGVTGALSSRAESVFGGLDVDQRAIARRILLRGVHPGDETGDARRPVPPDDLLTPDVSADDVERVLAALVDARLLTASHDAESGSRRFELAHEALIDGWPRLRGWVDEARGWLLDTRRLVTAARDWQRHDRHEEWLLRGLRLAEAERLVAAASDGEVDLAVPSRAVELVTASAEVRDDEVRRRRVHRQVAAIRGLLDDALRSLDDDPQRALLLALVAAGRQSGVPDMSTHPVDDVLHRALAAQRLVRHLPDVGHLLALDPHAGVVVTSPADMDHGSTSGLEVRDATTGEVRRVLPGQRNALRTAVFARRGTLLVTGCQEEVLRVWRVEDGTLLRQLEGGPGTALSVWDVHPSGDLVVGGDLGQLIEDDHPPATLVWDLRTGRLQQRIPPGDEPLGRPAGPSDAALNPDGSLLGIAVWADPSSSQLVDVTTGECLLSVSSRNRVVTTVAWSPDGTWLATGGDQVTVIDVPARRVHATWIPPDGMVGGGLVWAGDSRRLFVATRTVQQWNARLGQHELTFRGAGSAGSEIRLFRGLDGLVSGSRTGGAIDVWDVSAGAGAEVARVDAHRNASVAFSPGGARLAVATDEGVAIHDAAAWSSVVEVPADVGDERLIAWSPDGTRLVVAGTAGLDLLDPTTCTRVFTRGMPEAMVEVDAVAFSPDGSSLAVAERIPPGPDGTWSGGYRIVVTDRDGIDTTRIERHGEGRVLRMQFSPDGEWLVVARFGGLIPMWPVDAGVDLWDWRSGAAVWAEDALCMDVAFDPAGERLVVGSMTGHVEVWDATTGRVLRRLGAHTSTVGVVSWSLDGRLIVTGAEGGVVRVWDGRTGEAAYSLQLDGVEPVMNVDISDDGRLLAVGQESRGVWVWMLDHDELVAIAQSRVRRQLTEDERRAHLSGDWPD